MNRVIAGLIVSSVFATSAQAVTINTFYRADGSLPAYAVGQATVFQSFNAAAANNNVNFNAAANNAINTLPGYTQTTTGRVRTFQNSVAGQATGPTPAQGGNGAFIAIGNNGNDNSTYSIGFNTAVSLFSFVFSTLDSYNSVSLKFAGVAAPVVLTGGQIRTGLVSTGIDDFAQSGGRVTYDFGTDKLEAVTFGSTQIAFEIDQIAAAVPEPGTWAMMILGFGFAGWQLRARRQPKVSFAAA